MKVKLCKKCLNFLNNKNLKDSLRKFWKLYIQDYPAIIKFSFYLFICPCNMIAFSICIYKKFEIVSYLLAKLSQKGFDKFGEIVVKVLVINYIFNVGVIDSFFFIQHTKICLHF